MDDGTNNCPDSATDASSARTEVSSEQRPSMPHGDTRPPRITVEEARRATITIIDLARRFEAEGTCGSRRDDARFARIVKELRAQEESNLQALVRRRYVSLAQRLAHLYARYQQSAFSAEELRERVEELFHCFGFPELNERSLTFLSDPKNISAEGGPVKFAAEALEQVFAERVSARSIFNWLRGGGLPEAGHPARQRRALERLLYVVHALQETTRRMDWGILRSVEVQTRWRLRKLRKGRYPRPPRI